MQTWPEWFQTAVAAASGPEPGSESSKKMFGLLPPSSSVTRFRRLAAAAWIARPVSTDPVKWMASTRGCWTRAAPPRTYVAIGASDAVGVGANDPATEGWVPRLAQLLGPDTRLRNLGVSGTLIRTALQDQVPAAVREQPDLVTVWLAVNDLDAHTSLASYSADLDSLLFTLARQTHASVLVANVPETL